MARLFISQEQMDRWTADGKVKLEDDVMSLPALGRSFRLQTAVHFTKTIDGADVEELLGRVKSDSQLTALGAEHYGTSVILGEVGYECEEGFIGSPVDVAAGGMTGSGLLKLDQ
jgi:hypothetical protein